MPSELPQQCYFFMTEFPGQIGHISVVVCMLINLVLCCLLNPVEKSKPGFTCFPIICARKLLLRALHLFDDCLSHHKSLISEFFVFQAPRGISKSSSTLEEHSKRYDHRAARGKEVVGKRKPYSSLIKVNN